jgi:alkylation response protein AidB-like acyl-CoA dehydrogenase
MAGTTKWVEVARSFAPMIEQHADEAEQNRRQPKELIDAWRDAGLFRLWVPRDYGGEELDLATYLEVIEAVSAVDGSAGWTLMIGSEGGAFAAYLPPPVAREIFGSGRTVIAGSVTPRNAAVTVDGGYMVTARWPFASGCPEAEWLVGFSLIPADEDAGDPVNRPGPPRLIAMFMPESDCRIIDTWTSLGLRATASHDFEVREVFVPRERVYRGGPGSPAKPMVGGSMYRGGDANLLQIGLVGVHLGIAQAAVDAIVRLANEKTPTMRPSKLRESPVAQAQIARAEGLRLSARSLALDTARLLQLALAEGTLEPRHIALRQLTVAHVAKSCSAAVDIAYEVGGTTGVFAGNKLERCFRDIHVATQHMGVSPNQFAMAGLGLLDAALATSRA